MNWIRIALSAVLPLPFAFGAAWLVWRRDVMLGSILGAGVVFAAAVTFMGREWVDVQRENAACLAAIARCGQLPDPFSRMAPYAITAFLDVIILFGIGFLFEYRRRERAFAREWR